VVCLGGRLFLCSDCQLVLEGLVRRCRAFDRQTFPCHQSMEFGLFGAYDLAWFSPIKGWCSALVGIEVTLTPL